jgi:hypothetical protein
MPEGSVVCLSAVAVRLVPIVFQPFQPVSIALGRRIGKAERRKREENTFWS